MQYIADPVQFQKNAATPAGRALTAQMERDVAWFAAHFSDDPAVDSGWGHAYFCPDDGAFLQFDLSSPTAHRCPVCGRILTDPIYSAAWVYLYRYAALMSALEAAVLYRLAPRAEYLRHFMRIIGFYSDHYSEFAVHGKGPTTSGNGKITPQALNEAIFIAKVVNGMELLKADLPASFTDGVKKNLLLCGARFINAQKKIIHNIPCWINAGVGLAGLFCGDEELAHLAYDAPLGLADQVRQGVTESNFWYEGSIHYDCFTIESFMHLFLFADIYGREIPADVRDTVYRMLLAPCKMAFSNSVLPNPNDGWPNLNLKTYSYLYETGARVFGGEELANILANIYAQPVARTPLPMSSPVYCGDMCMEQLLFSRGERAPQPLEMWRTSCLFEASNYAILRRAPVEVFVKYGHRTPSHAHPDKMNLEVTAFGQKISRDLSNCGYAARLCNEFYRTSVSHNTAVLDGISHPTTLPGECLRYEPDPACITVRAAEAYPGTDFVRAVTLTQDGFTDTFAVTGDKEHVMDWFFHAEGQLESELDTAPASLGYAEGGYQHLRDVRAIAAPNGEVLRLRWRFAGGVTGVQELSLDGVQAFVCESYDNPVNRMRTTVILRARASHAVFAQTWHFSKEE